MMDCGTGFRSELWKFKIGIYPVILQMMEHRLTTLIAMKMSILVLSSVAVRSHGQKERDLMMVLALAAIHSLDQAGGLRLGRKDRRWSVL